MPKLDTGQNTVNCEKRKAIKREWCRIASKAIEKALNLFFSSVQRSRRRLFYHFQWGTNLRTHYFTVLINFIISISRLKATQISLEKRPVERIWQQRRMKTVTTEVIVSLALLSFFLALSRTNVSHSVPPSFTLITSADKQTFYAYGCLLPRRVCSLCIYFWGVCVACCLKSGQEPQTIWYPGKKELQKLSKSF